MNLTSKQTRNIGELVQKVTEKLKHAANSRLHSLIQFPIHLAESIFMQINQVSPLESKCRDLKQR